MERAADRLLFAGHTFCDVVMADVDLPEAGGEAFASDLRLSPGGVANRAVAAARLGAPTSLLTVLGDDVFGREVRRVLALEDDLDLTHTRVDAHYRTAVSVALTGAVDRTFVTYEVPAPALDAPGSADAVRATHVNLAAPLPSWVAPLRSGGTRVVAGVGWDATGAWSADVLERLSEVDVFVPNAVEAMRYTRTDDPTAAARALAERVACVIVTCGPDGAVAIDAHHGEVRVPAVPVEVRDPTGAGDVFVAAWMAVADRGWSFAQTLRLACLAAACSLRGLGGALSAPTRDDLLTYIRHHSLPDWTFLEDWAAEHAARPAPNPRSARVA